MERNLSKPIIINSYPGDGNILLELNRRERMTTHMKAWHQKTLGLHFSHAISHSETPTDCTENQTQTRKNV